MDNFATSSPFMDPNYDWREYINNAFTSQGMDPYYSAEQMAVPPPTFQQQLDTAFGAGNSPFLTYDQREANIAKGLSPYGASHMVTRADGTTYNALAGMTSDPAARYGTDAPSFGAPTSPMAPSSPAPGGYAVAPAAGGGGGGAGKRNRYLDGGAPAAPTGAATSAGLPGYGMGSNPFQGGQAQGIYDYTNQLLGQNLNGIASRSIGVGGLGGMRQGVAQAGAIGQAANYLSKNIADLYGSNWNADANRAVQNRGLDVTMRGQDIQWQDNVNDYLLGQGRLDLDTTKAGADITHLANQDSWMPYIVAGDLYKNFMGGGTSTQDADKWQGILGGILAGAQAGNLYK